MITRQSVAVVGQLFKPHGIKGELSASLDYDDLSPADLKCLITDIDGILVPFFVDSCRQRGGSSWLIKFDGIDNESDAAALANHELFALRSDLPDDSEGDDSEGVHLFDLVGYTLSDAGRAIGTIEAIDDSTPNILFNVKTPEGDIVLVPFAEEFIAGLDTAEHVIDMELPEGLIDLNL